MGTGDRRITQPALRRGRASLPAVQVCPEHARQCVITPPHINQQARARLSKIKQGRVHWARYRTVSYDCTRKSNYPLLVCLCLEWAHSRAKVGRAHGSQAGTGYPVVSGLIYMRGNFRAITTRARNLAPDEAVSLVMSRCVDEGIFYSVHTPHFNVRVLDSLLHSLTKKLKLS